MPRMLLLCGCHKLGVANMDTNHTFKLLMATVLIIVTALGKPSSHQATAQGGVNLRLPFNGTRRLTAYVDHRSPTYGQDTYSNIVVYNGEDRPECVECGQAWTTQGPYCYNGHSGTDYSLYREPVLAAASGRVTFRGVRSSDYGNSIRIDHGNGYETWYSHMESFSVNQDSEVSAGQQIGISGNTGTGQPYHLHFEVLYNGNVTDPFGWRGNDQDPLAGGAVCLWGDGQCAEIVIEDDSEGFLKSLGTPWNWDCRGNSWTMRWFTNVRDSASPTAVATWRPSSPYDGYFVIEAFVAAVHGSTTAAKYQVYAKDGYHYVTINQHDKYDEWVSLGTFEFVGGGNNNVYLSNATGEPDGTTEVCFDTVRFRQFRIFLPVILNSYSQ